MRFYGVVGNLKAWHAYTLSVIAYEYSAAQELVYTILQ